MPNIPNLVPDPQLPEYRWNARIGRYIDSRGRFVSAATIRGQLDRALDATADAMALLSGNLRAGAITLAEWQTEMMALSKEANLLGAALERGGWLHLTQADFGRIGAIVRQEYGHIREFAQAIQSGKQKLDGTLDRRARLYGQHGRTTYYVFSRLGGAQAGATEERRILGQADHCADCVGYAERGWVPIGTLPLPGEGSVCRTNCKCKYETR